MIDPRTPLAMLCARLRCEAEVIEEGARRVVVTLRRAGEIIGTATGETVAAATRVHQTILEGRPDRGPVPAGALYECDPHPALASVAYRTKRAGLAAESVRDYLDAAAGDEDGVSVRLWLTTDPRDCPADCKEDEG